MFETIHMVSSEKNSWQIDYDKERGMYRVSLFEDNHFVDDVTFDEIEPRYEDDLK